MMLTGAFRLCH